jgi:hypothetical protein
VYAGALLIETYDAAPGTVGLLLGTAATAAFHGNFVARRWLSGSSRELLVVLGLSAAMITAVFGIAGHAAASLSGPVGAAVCV